MDKNLTEKQKRFADYYITTGNAMKSYIEAGYKVGDKVAAANASRLLTNAKVKNYIDKQIAKKDKSRIASQDEVLEFYTKVFRGDENDVFVDGWGRAHEVPAQIKERIKAADALAKRYGIDKPEVDNEITKLQIELVRRD